MIDKLNIRDLIEYNNRRYIILNIIGQDRDRRITLGSEDQNVITISNFNSILTFKILKPEDFINETKLLFVDISSELYRVYYYDDNRLFIFGPNKLHVSDNKSHRVTDIFGKNYYIKDNWNYIEFKNVKDKPNYVL